MLAVALLLPACSAEKSTQTQAKPVNDLEQAAISAGVIADPRSADITGLYARDTDRLCIVPSATAWSAGVHVDYGDGLACSGQAVVSRSGEMLRFSFGSEGCAFDARFDGDRIVFPGRVPEACQKLCSKRVSLAALDVERQSDSAAEAATLRDSKGRLLCQN